MPTVEKAASEYTDYIKKRATVVGRREFSDSLFNSLVLQSSVGRGLGNTPEGPIPSGGDYGVLTGFNLNNKVLWYPSFGDLGDFTVELFFKCSDVNEGGDLWRFDNINQLIMRVNNGFLRVNSSGDEFNYDVNITSVTPDTWYHFALTRNGTNWYASINGTTFEVILGSLDLTGLSLCIGDFEPSEGNEFYSGSISNFRISTPKYSTGTYTIPSVPLSASGAKLLLLAKQDAPFADSTGTYVSEYQCEWAPGPIPSIPQPRPDYGVLTGFNTNNTLFYPTFGMTGDFTMELFFKSNDPQNAGYEALCFFETGEQAPYIGILLQDGLIKFIDSENDESSLGLIEANTWYHVAFSRNGATTYISVNGYTQLMSDSLNLNISGVGLNIGGYGGIDGEAFSCSISNVRISNFARYSDNYTLPTVPMEPATTDLLLLLAKPDAPFADTALPSRTPKISTTSCGWAPGPIELPTTDYGVLTGFNTSGSILSYPEFGDLGTNFTVELFFKISDTNTYQILWEIGGTGGTVGMYIESDKVYLQYANPSNPVNDPIIFYPGANTWYHVAVTQEGSNWYTSVNGNTQGLGIPNITITDAKLEIGVTDDNNDPLESGSISNFRISSVAKYKTPGSYDVPTIPMEPASTDLLLLLAKPDAPFADTVLSREPKRPANTCKWGPGPIVAPITEYGLLTGFVDTPLYYSSIGVMPPTFTIEFFFKWNGTYGYLFTMSITSGNNDNIGDYFSATLSGGAVGLEGSSVSDKNIGQTNSNTWYHFALTRDGSDWYASMNGNTEVWDITGTNFYGVNLDLTIGGDYDNSGKIDGSISNFRISNVAKYKTPGSYVVPSVPMLPASTDLLLLLAKPGEPFVDSSSFDRTPTETCEWAPGEPIVV